MFWFTNGSVSKTGDQIPDLGAAGTSDAFEAANHRYDKRLNVVFPFASSYFT